MVNDVVLAYFLIALGVLLMAAELLLPLGGLLLVLGVGGLIAGIAMLFSYDAMQALVTLIVILVLLLVGGPMLLSYWPHTAWGRQLILTQHDDDAAVAAMPVHLELEPLRGQTGRTVSPLRPSGVTDFNGRRIDTLSDGPMIEAGKWVRCIDVREGRVIVREIDAPPALQDLEFDRLT
jgi:membrane-bound ClpP family serine protease